MDILMKGMVLMTKEKKTFYVSVQAGSIVQHEGDTSFEFEIEATEEEINQLQQIFNGKEKADDQAFLRAHQPWKEYRYDEPNDRYDHFLSEAYQLIYELGTPETKQHIERMNVLGGALEREPIEAERQPLP